MTAPEAPAAPAEPPQEGTQGREEAHEELSPDALRAELTRARADAAKYRQRAKQAGDDEWYAKAQGAVEALDRVEQEKKSEVERAVEKATADASRAAKAESELSRLRVALQSGVDPSQVDEFASRLRGDSEDELKADADTLRTFFQPVRAERRGDPTQGAGAEPVNPSDALAAFLQQQVNAR